MEQHGQQYSTEVLAGAGFDWILLDAEHAPNDVQSVLGQLQATMEHTTSAMVRVPFNETDPDEVRALLEVAKERFCRVEG